MDNNLLWKLLRLTSHEDFRYFLLLHLPLNKNFNKPFNNGRLIFFTGNHFGEVRMEGLEPPHLAASDPKSDVSTNFTTCAFGAAKVMISIKKNAVINIYGFLSASNHNF